MKKTILLFLIVLSSGHVFADDIEVPEEELARESVLPVFDNQRAVLNRNVMTNKRLEVSLGAGLELNEPYYNDMMFNLQGTYNYSETSAVNVQGLYWGEGLSSYGEQLKAGGTKFQSFDASKVPHPEWGVFLNYEYIAYYGKISVTKKSVMNLNLFGLAGLGYINMGEKSTVGANLGIGQNFFITNNVGLRFDLRCLIFQGPNATTQNLGPNDNPSADAFGDRIFYNTQMGLNLVVIL